MVPLSRSPRRVSPRLARPSFVPAEWPPECGRLPGWPKQPSNPGFVGGIMFTLLRQAEWRRALAVEVPAFAISLVTAEVLYKFKSFTLECLAFLATWVVVGAVLHAASSLFHTAEAANQG